MVHGALLATRRCRQERRGEVVQPDGHAGVSSGERAMCSSAGAPISAVATRHALGAARPNPHRLARHVRGADRLSDVPISESAGHGGANSEELSGERKRSRPRAPGVTNPWSDRTLDAVAAIPARERVIFCAEAFLARRASLPDVPAAGGSGAPRAGSPPASVTASSPPSWW